MKKNIGAQPPAAATPPEIIISHSANNMLLMHLAGSWRIDQPMHSI
jgi:hypothetical protein